MNKNVKNLSNDMLALGIIEIILRFLDLVVYKNIHILGLIGTVLIFVTFYLAKKENKIAGILGIIISISIIIGLIGVIARLIDIVLGIFILIHSIKYLKEN